MILGMTPFTFAHVLISLIGIGSGFVVLFALLTSKRLHAWTLLFLTSTIATSVTGFFFPFRELLPSHILGVLSLIVLTVAVIALYRHRLEGVWGPLYAASAVTALYFNCFVLIVQAFLKVPALNALAPTQTELPFVAAQGIALLAFGTAGFAAVNKMRPTRRRPQAA